MGRVGFRLLGMRMLKGLGANIGLLSRLQVFVSGGFSLVCLVSTAAQD